MRRDPTAFRERFKAWQQGELVYKGGLPAYGNGKNGGYTDEQKKVIDKVYKTLKEAGYDDYAIAGILGNAHTESQFNPDSVGSSHYGLFLNDKHIRDAIIAQYGDYSIDSQLKYIMEWNDRADWIRNGQHSGYTSMNSGKFKKSGYKDSQEASNAWMRLYERPVIMKDGKVVGYQGHRDRLRNSMDAYNYIDSTYNNPEATKTSFPIDWDLVDNYQPVQPLAPQQPQTPLKSEPYAFGVPQKGMSLSDTYDAFDRGATAYGTNRLSPIQLKLPSLDEIMAMNSPANLMKQQVALLLPTPNLPDVNPKMAFKDGKLPTYGGGKMPQWMVDRAKKYKMISRPKPFNPIIEDVNNIEGKFMVMPMDGFKKGALAGRRKISDDGEDIQYADATWHENWLNNRLQLFDENVQLARKRFKKDNVDTIEKLLNNLRNMEETFDPAQFRNVTGNSAPFYSSLAGIGAMVAPKQDGSGNIAWYSKPLSGIPYTPLTPEQVPSWTLEQVDNWNAKRGYELLPEEDVEETKVHERTHALSPFDPSNPTRTGILPQHEKIRQINKAAGIQSTKTSGHDSLYDNFEYHNDPEETYSGLMEQRYKMGLTPDHVVTPEEIQQWRGDKKLNPYLENKPDDVLLLYFNDVASTNTKSSYDKLPMAKNGKLPKYGDGIKVLNNTTNAKFNDDGTFTDDITKAFDDLIVTPKGVTTKYGSYTDRNWDRYKQEQEMYNRFGKYRDPVTSKLRGEPGLEIISPEFDIIGGIRGILLMLPTNKSKSIESIDWDAIKKGIEKLKAAEDEWLRLHPEDAKGLLEGPKLVDAYDELPQMIRDISPDINTRIINGYIERFGLNFPQYTNKVQNIYRKQIIPRRAQAFADNQLTSGVYKVLKYMKDNLIDDVDFSTKEGLQIASDNKWTFDEMADWSDYKQYVQKLEQYADGSWTEYTDDAWDKIYPIKDGKIVSGDYMPAKDEIRVKRGADALLHESRHRMDNYVPLTKRERKTLMDAYGFLDRSDPKNIQILNDELVTTNAELRDLLLSRVYGDDKSLGVLSELLNSEKWISDEVLLESLRSINSYGRRIVEGIEKELGRKRDAWSRLGWDESTLSDRISQQKKEYVLNIRHALNYVGGSAAGVTFVNKRKGDKSK